MISIKVSDCITTDFAKIHPEMPVADASAELIKKTSLGGPVTDQDGKLVGWISEQECLQVTLQVAYHNTRIAVVKDVMREDVLSVTLDDDPLAIAQDMLKAKPKNYPVVDKDNKVIGVLTRRNILNMLDKNLRHLESKK